MLDAIQLVTGVAWWAVGQETGIGHNIKPVPQPYKLKFAYLIALIYVNTVCISYFSRSACISDHNYICTPIRPSFMQKKQSIFNQLSY